MEARSCRNSAKKLGKFTEASGFKEDSAEVLPYIERTRRFDRLRRQRRHRRAALVTCSSHLEVRLPVKAIDGDRNCNNNYNVHFKTRSSKFINSEMHLTTGVGLQ